jgi:hypothetical protein
MPVTRNSNQVDRHKCAVTISDGKKLSVLVECQHLMYSIHIIGPVCLISLYNRLNNRQCERLRYAVGLYSRV